MLTYKDRCVGTMLGASCGDILGAGVEFQTREEIQRVHGKLRCFLDSVNRPLGMYTDDTEMMLALASSIIRCGKVDAEDCARSYVEWAFRPPRRGYGPETAKILDMLRNGADYRQAGYAIRPEGSFSSGGAMRIAPVALLSQLMLTGDSVADALLCTHVHPIAVDAARVMAESIGYLSSGATFDDSNLCKYIWHRVYDFPNLAYSRLKYALRDSLEKKHQVHNAR